MKNKVIKSILKFVSMFVLFIVIANFFTGCSLGKSDNSFSVSGVIVDDETNAPVENVLISSEKGEFYTDAEGKYTIDGIDSIIIVIPSKEGYHFETQSKKITKRGDDANFVASKEYTLNGFVKNNDVPVPNASIKISSLAGEFETTSNEEGRFVAQGVAGEATVKCSLNGEEFFRTTASILNPNVTITSLTNCKFKFVFDDNNLDPSKVTIRKIFGTESESFSDGGLINFPNVEFNDVKCRTIFEISSEFYDLDKKRIEITKLNQETTIVAHKFYNLNGYVKSGDEPLVGASLYISNSKVATSDNHGWFEIGGLTQNKTLDVVYQNFEFDSKNVNYNSSIVNFNGTKNVVAVFNFDHYVNNDILFSHESAKLVEGSYNKYRLSKVELGENIVLGSETYSFETPTFEISSADQYLISSNAYYDAAVNISGDFAYQYVLDGNVVSPISLQNLSGSHEISAQFENYVFETKSVDFDSNDITLGYKIPYNAKFKIMSGEISLINEAQVKLNGNLISVQENLDEQDNSVLCFNNIVGENDIEVVVDGYNQLLKTIDESFAEKLNVLNLTYSVSGIAKTGNVPILDATVSAGGNVVYTNDSGVYEIKNLSGSNKITISKAFYSFENQSLDVSKETSNLNFSATYTISGEVAADEGVTDLSTCRVTLSWYNVETASFENQVAYIENGRYSFSNLSGKYSLCIYDKNNELPLNPKSWAVTGGSDAYDFNFKGFSVNGKVMSGGIPVLGAKVVAGEDNAPVYTNEKGEYTFELIVDPCTIVVSKDGYDFGNGKAVAGETGTAVTANFEGTYSIYGQVVSGLVGIENVEVLIDGKVAATTDAEGNFVVSGISGGKELAFSKTGVVFDGTVQVKEYSKIRVDSSLQITLQAKTGTIAINNYNYFVNGQKIGTSQNSDVQLTAKIGDVITLQKNGYVFEQITVSKEYQYSANASYSVLGTVKSGSRELEGAIVRFLDTSVQTKRLSTGELKFIIDGLVGQVSLLVEMQGYNSENLQVDSYNDNLLFNLSYFVTGNVTVGKSGIALDGVDVKIKYADENGNQENTCKTDIDGNFKLEAIGEYALELSKENYSFAEIKNQFENKYQVISAKYSVLGFVKSGNLVVANKTIVALVEKGETVTRYATTGKDGSFKFENISDTCLVRICDENYESLEISGINNLKTDANFNVGYFVNLSFDVETNVNYNDGSKDLSILTNSENGKFVARLKLYGKIAVSFVASANATATQGHISYNPPSKTYSAPKTESIQSEITYMISGSVTSNGVAIANVQLKEGSRVFATSGEDGKYRDEYGNEAIFVPKNTEITLSLFGREFTNDKKTVKNDGNVNFTIDFSTFGDTIYRVAEEKLKDKNQALQVFSKKNTNRGEARPGDYSDSWVYGVPAMSSPTTQYIYSVFRRDSHGNTIKQNLNAGSTVLGVDPNLSLVVTNINGVIKYQDIRGSGNIENEYRAKHGQMSGLQDTTADYLKNTYGSYPTDCLPYNTNNLSTFSGLKIEDNCYVYSFKLSSSQDGYKKQISKLAPDGTSYKEFKYTQFTVKISKDGYLREVKVDENYKINKMVDVDVTAKIIYDFYYNDIATLSYTGNVNDWLSRDYNPN